MNIDCFICKKELVELGALVFSPPYTGEETTLHQGKVDKYHLCKKCWRTSYNFIVTLKDWFDNEKN